MENRQCLKHSNDTGSLKLDNGELVLIFAYFIVLPKKVKKSYLEASDKNDFNLSLSTSVIEKFSPRTRIRQKRHFKRIFLCCSTVSYRARNTGYNLQPMTHVSGCIDERFLKITNSMKIAGNEVYFCLSTTSIKVLRLPGTQNYSTR